MRNDAIAMQTVDWCRLGCALMHPSHKMRRIHCTQPTRCVGNNTYNGQERQQGVLGRRYGIVRVGVVGFARQQDPPGLVLVVHLLERHGGVALSRS